MVNNFDLKKAIKAYGYNTITIAPLLGTSQQAVSKAMNNPTLSKLMEICSAIGCTLEELVKAGSEDNSTYTNRVVCPHCGKQLNIKVEITSEN